jgi:hypothetical protein
MKCSILQNNSIDHNNGNKNIIIVIIYCWFLTGHFAVNPLTPELNPRKAAYRDF